MLNADSYVRHKTGDWKVSNPTEPVSVWRVAEAGYIEETSFPASELTLISIDESTWADPSDL